MSWTPSFSGMRMIKRSVHQDSVMGLMEQSLCPPGHTDTIPGEVALLAYVLCSSSLAAAGAALRAPNCSLQHPSKPHWELRPSRALAACLPLQDAPGGLLCPLFRVGWMCRETWEYTQSPPAHPQNAVAVPVFSQEFGPPGIFLVEMRCEGCSDPCPSTVQLV